MGDLCRCGCGFAAPRTSYYADGHKAKKRPAKVCAKCRVPLVRPRGNQRFCDPCRLLTCRECGKRFIPPYGNMAQQCCSLRCSALNYPEAIERLKRCRGNRPRTYAKRRNKHGSAEDREWRVAVFVRDDYTCQKCGVRGGKLNAHHVKDFGQHPELRHELSNGVTLCVDCHKTTDNFGWKAYWAKVRANELAAKRIDREITAGRLFPPEPEQVEQLTFEEGTP